MSESEPVLSIVAAAKGGDLNFSCCHTGTLELHQTLELRHTLDHTEIFDTAMGASQFLTTLIIARKNVRFFGGKIAKQSQFLRDLKGLLKTELRPTAIHLEKYS